MKTTIIFGAGQGGKALLKMLSPDYRVLAYMDNDYNKWGKKMDGLPVVSIEEALAISPDCIWVATMNDLSGQQMAQQLIGMGYGGEIRHIGILKKDIDLRMAALRRMADQIHARNIGGYVAELGVYRGDFAAEINRYFPDRQIFLFDTFQGFPLQDMTYEQSVTNRNTRHMDFSSTSANYVLSRLPYPDKAVIFEGRFPDTAPRDNGLQFAFVSLDADLFAPTYSGLNWFFPRLSHGGVILIHDFYSDQFPGVRKAAERYFQEINIFPFPLSDIHGSIAIMKMG